LGCLDRTQNDRLFAIPEPILHYHSKMSARMPSRPAFIYGTAWKKDATAGLVKTAVNTGFKAIDTANQPKHYQEPLVGDAVKSLAAEGVSRESLWMQTKFTPINGQDHRVPYDPHAPLQSQVR